MLVGGLRMGDLPVAPWSLKRLGYWARQGNVAERRLQNAVLAGDFVPSCRGVDGTDRESYQSRYSALEPAGDRWAFACHMSLLGSPQPGCWQLPRMLSRWKTKTLPANTGSLNSLPWCSP